MGRVNMTSNWHPCLDWTEFNLPKLQDGGDIYVFPDRHIQDAGNYCRNPNGRDRPWCIVSAEGQWEYCNISLCGKLNFVTMLVSNDIQMH